MGLRMIMLLCVATVLGAVGYMQWHSWPGTPSAVPAPPSQPTSPFAGHLPPQVMYSPAPPAEEFVPPIPDGHARYRSRHYLIITDLPRARAATFADHMDSVYEEYTRRFSSFTERSDLRMPVYLFHKQDDYTAFLNQYHVQATNSGGLFVTHPQVRGVFVWTEDRTDSELFRTLQHEGFHQFALTSIGPQLPVWVNEGLAEYFEDAILLEDRMIIGLADEAKLLSVRRGLNENTLPSLDDLLGMPNDEWIRTLIRDPQRSRLLYNQSWSIVHFLVHAEDGRYRKPFETFLHRVGQAQDPHQVFVEAYSDFNLRDLDTRWRAYVRSIEPDPLNTAITRMEFLGQAMAFLHQRGERVPMTLIALKQRLESYRYRSWRTRHGIRTEYDSANHSLYEYPIPGKPPRMFTLLEPSRIDQPPRISAIGLRPEPTLVWDTAPDGKLTFRITYR